MQDSLNLDGRMMNVIETDPGGVVNQDTLFSFYQKGTRVLARYAGGGIKNGCLVGHIKQNRLSFRYLQIDTEQSFDHGHSECGIEMTTDGRLRLVEHFQWESRETAGVNIFEELTGPLD